jgi:hypothetical protein
MTVSAGRSNFKTTGRVAFLPWRRGLSAVSVEVSPIWEMSGESDR